jgi:putative sterol carrier protein
VAGFLSKEWLDGADLVVGGAGRPVTVRRVVTGGPEGDVTLEAEVSGPDVGAPQGGSRTAAAVPAELTLTTTYDVALALDAGDVAPAVAYMQGRLKAEGDMPTLYAVLATR